MPRERVTPRARVTQRPADCVLETERLWLCRIDAERDFDRFAETYADKDTVRYIGGKVLDRAQAWRMMATVVGHWQLRGYGFFSCIRKDGGDHIGRIGPWYPEGWPAPEVGWTLHPDFQGRGYAREAGRASIDHVFRDLGWERVVHVIQHGNTASAGLATRLGSRHIGELDGIPGVSDEPCWLFGQTRAEWAQRG